MHGLALEAHDDRSCERLRTSCAGFDDEDDLGARARRVPEQTTKWRRAPVSCSGASVAPKVTLEPWEYLEDAGMGLGAARMSLVQSLGKS